MTTATRTVEPVVAAPGARPDFHVLTGSLKVKEDGEGGRPTVVATASSTAIDLEADRFTATALKQMKDGFVGRLIFLNHSYKVPMDVFGVVEGAELVKREGRLDLDLSIGVEMNNPLAVQTYEYIKGGIVLGVSVGVIVTEAEKNKDEEEDERGRTVVDISGVIPLEASIVGIPANQTAWTREAVKSLFASGRIAFDAEEIAARPWLQTVVGAGKEDNMATKHEEEAAAAAQAETEAAAQAETEAAAAAEAESAATDPDEEAAAQAEAEVAADAEATDPDEEAAAQAEAEAAADEIEAAAAALAAAAEAAAPQSEGDEEKDTSAKAVWSTAFINKLPDSAFAVILAGGKKDEDGKTTPRNLRKLPHHGPDGKVDKPHLNNALSREPQTQMPAAAHAKAKAHLNKHAGKKSADFDEDVSADMAADELIDKMFSGFRILVNSLVKVLLNSELSLPDRQKAGAEIIEQYQAFVSETWDETIEGLEDESKSERGGDFNLDAHLHDALSEADGVACDVAGYEALVAKVAEVGDFTKSFAEERDALRKESEQKSEAISYLERIIEVMMELPLPTVTTKGNGRVGQSLAERFPALDTRVVERMARYAPPDPTARSEKE